MEEILILILYLGVFYFFDQGLFRHSETKECKKANGNCKNCKAWSCYKGNLEFRKEKNKNE